MKSRISDQSRSNGQLERRASPAGATVDLVDDRYIRGYSIVFNVLSEDLGGFRERILPQAVDRSLSSDVRALVDHDTGKVLGRTRSGTLTLRKDPKGLFSTIDPDLEISYARDIVRSVNRGDVTGQSFGFIVVEDNWHMEDGEAVRDVIDMDLKEISVVTFPAYLETTVSMSAQRSLKEFRQQIKRQYDWRRLYNEMMSDE
jgi:HK97 family phage prohead protease